MRGRLHQFLLFILTCHICSGSLAQIPFDCTGQFYISFTTPTTSSLVEAVIDPITEQVQFINISNDLGTFINGAGYRVTDNFIYAVEPLFHNLYRIDAIGSVTDLGKLDLQPNHVYLAADISPDGQFLVLIGTLGLSPNDRDEEMKLVDLTSPTFDVTTRSLGGTPVTMFDIAFDPTDGTLYGVDASGNRLVTIDYFTGVVTASFPPTDLMDDAGSLFFDSFGDLYAYGGPPGNGGIQNTLYKVDKATGEFRILTTGTRATATDGCSCPHTVELRKVVQPSVMVPCGEVDYVFTIANSSSEAQSKIDFQDTLPPGFVFSEVKYNPYGGSVVGIGTNIINIKDLTLLPGIDSIILRVEVGNVPDGLYKNQAVLHDLPQALGTMTLSDNPATTIKHDSTALLIQSHDTIVRHTLLICEGNTIALDASIYGSSFVWSDGTTGAINMVSKPGLYTAQAITDCDTLLVQFQVNTIAIEAEFDPASYQIRFGDSVRLSPQIYNEGSIVSYQWFPPEGQSVICPTCPEILVTPFYDTEYTVVVENEAGCTSTASVLVQVDRTRRVFAPNVFSPNGDNVNDEFFFQVRGVAEIRKFTLYDRWGDVLQSATLPFMRDPKVQWNGLRNLDTYLPGVYVWVAEVGFIDGTHEIFSGDVTLVR